MRRPEKCGGGDQGLERINYAAIPETVSLNERIRRYAEIPPAVGGHCSYADDFSELPADWAAFARGGHANQCLGQQLAVTGFTMYSLTPACTRSR
jgi:hypothetical protein